MKPEYREGKKAAKNVEDAMKRIFRAAPKKQQGKPAASEKIEKKSDRD
jgi:hypothetical protein